MECLYSKLVSSILLVFFISGFPLSSVANAMNSSSSFLHKKRTRGIKDLTDEITKKYEYVERDLLEKVLGLSNEVKDNIESVIYRDDADDIIEALFVNTCLTDIKKLLKIKTESGSSVFDLILSNKRPANVINYFLSLYRECRQKDKKEIKKYVDQLQKLLLKDIKDGESIFGKILKNNNAINIFKVMLNNEKLLEHTNLIVEANGDEKSAFCAILEHDDSSNILKKLFNYNVILENRSLFFGIINTLLNTDVSTEGFFNAELSGDEVEIISKFFKDLNQDSKAFFSSKSGEKTSFDEILKEKSAVGIIKDLFFRPNNIEFVKSASGYYDKRKFAYGDSLFKRIKMLFEAKTKDGKSLIEKIKESNKSDNIISILINQNTMPDEKIGVGIINTLLNTDVSVEEFFNAELSGDEVGIISKFFKDLNQNSKAFFSLKPGKKVSFEEILKEKSAVEIIEDLFFRPNNINFVKLVYGHYDRSKYAYGDSLFKIMKMLFEAKTEDCKSLIEKIKKSKKSDNIISILINQKYNACEKMKVLFDSKTGKDEYVLDKILLREDSDSIINALLGHGSAHVMMKILFDARTEKDDFIFDNILKREDAVGIIDQLYCCGSTNSESLKALLEAKVGEHLFFDKVLKSKDAFGIIKVFLTTYGYKTESWKKLFEAKSEEGTFIFDKILEYDNAANFIDTLLSSVDLETVKILFSKKFEENYILDKIWAEGGEASSIIWALGKYKGGVAKFLFSSNDLTRFTSDVLFCKHNNLNNSKNLILELDNKEYKFGNNILKNIELLLDGTGNFENFKSRVEFLLEKYRENILPVFRPNIISIPLFAE